MANIFDQFDQAPTPVSPARATPSAPAAAPVVAGNPFDRFDPPAPAAPAVKDDLAGQFGAGIVKGIPNAVTGLSDLMEKGVADNLLMRNPDTGRGTVETFVDAWGDLLSGKPATPLEPTKEGGYQPVSGGVIRSGLDATGLNPDKYFRPPETAGERIAELGGEGLITSILSPNKAQGWQKLVQAGKEMLIGAGAGAGAQAGMEVAPEWADPLVGLGAGLAAGVGTAGLVELPGAAARGVKNTLRYVEPAVANRKSVERMAGEQLAATVGDRDATIAALGNADEIVPDSRPTAFQATGDIGLGSLERALARGDDEFKRKLIERIEKQNEARVSALDAIQDSGNPALVADFFRGRMRELEDTANELYSVAEKRAKGDYEGLGERPAGEIGEQARTAIETQFKTLNSEANKLWESIDPDGTLVVGTKPLVDSAAKIYGAISPEEMLSVSPKEKALAGIIGTYDGAIPFKRFKDLRSEISAAMREAKMTGQGTTYGRLSRLRSAIEEAVSDSIAGKMEADPSLADDFVRKARDWYTSRIEGEAGDRAVASVGNRADVAPSAAAGPSVARSAESRQPAGDAGDPRLSEDAIGEAANEAATSELNDLPPPTQAQKESGNYRKGHVRLGGLDISIENPSGSKRTGTGPDGRPWSVDMKDHYGYLRGTVGKDKDHLDVFVSRESPTEFASDAPVFVVDQVDPKTGRFDEHKILIGYPDRATAEAAYRSNYAKGWKGMGAITPTTLGDLKAWIKTGETKGRFANFRPDASMIDKGAAGRFKAASDATRNIKDTFGTKPVKGIMRRPGPTYPYEMSPENVSAQIFKAGPEGAANIQNVMKAGATKDAIEAAAVLSAKRSASKEGAFDPAKFAAWRAKHTDALKQIPEIDQKLSSAASAAKAMIETGERNAKVIAEVRKTAIGKLLNVEAGADVAATIGSMLNRSDAVKAMRDLAKEAAGDPNALEGLRRAVVDHMLTRLKTPKDALRPDTFQRFLGKNAPALAQVLTPEQMSSLRAIAQDLKRASRDVRAPGGGSDTAENLAARGKYLHDKPSIIQTMIQQSIGSVATHAAASFFAPGLTNAMTWVAQTLGGTVLQSMRSAGIKRVDDLIKEAILDPELMKALLMKAPKAKNRGSALTLSQKLGNIAAMNLALGISHAQEQDETGVERRRADQSAMAPMSGG